MIIDAHVHFGATDGSDRLDDLHDKMIADVEAAGIDRFAIAVPERAGGKQHLYRMADALWFKNRHPDRVYVFGGLRFDFIEQGVSDRTAEELAAQLDALIEMGCDGLKLLMGKPDSRTKEIIRLVRKAQNKAVKFIKAGILAREADRSARQIISEAGYGKNFGHSLGHGVGLAVHEPPSLNRMRRNKLKPGMVVTVEPGVYIPGWGGVRLENMVVVEDGGCTVFNKDTTFLDV